ncbi:MAG: flagellar protein FlaG [Bacillota bacterium]
MEIEAANNLGSKSLTGNMIDDLQINKIRGEKVFLEEEIEERANEEFKSKFEGDQFPADEKKEELEEVIEELNDITGLLDRKLGFELHEKTETLMTQIIDIETEDVIKEMPPHEMLDMAAKISEMVGLIIDEKV